MFSTKNNNVLAYFIQLQNNLKVSPNVNTVCFYFFVVSIFSSGIFDFEGVVTLVLV